jgi:HTH-type transcriptional regulator / antitoxin HigA
MELKPIKTKAAYKEALKEITALLDAPSGSPEADRLEVLSILVEAYEEEHHPIDPPDPIEAIRFRMEQQGLTRRDLEPFLGNRARVSEVLNRRRPLSVEMIRRLHKGLGIPAEILIRPYKTGEAA